MSDYTKSKLNLSDHNLSHNEGWDKTLLNLADLTRFTTDFFDKINSRLEISSNKL